MEMDGVISEESRRRRLPRWMLGVTGAVAAADKVMESQNADEVNDSIVEGGIASLFHQPKSKAGIAQGAPCDKEDLGVEPSLLVKCEKKGSRKTGWEETDCGGSNVCKTRFEKHINGRVGRKAREAAPWKRRKAKSYESKSGDEIEDPLPTEDDGDLTMEDLMSIAKEYVKSDKDTEQHQLSDVERKEENQFPATISRRCELRGYLDATQSNRSPTCMETAPCHTIAESSTTEGTLFTPSMTEDSTQDMLDLFLGPLLKKPLQGEKKVVFIREDITFACELSKQRQNVVLREDLAPLTKKKSSLKDKVAMFLD